METLNSSTVKPGELDPSFAGDGKFDVPGGNGSVRSIIDDGQGGFLLAAEGLSECCLYRIFKNGTQDLQFGQNGVSKWSFNPGGRSRPVQLLRQLDGKIILIGMSRDLGLLGWKPAFTRFHPSGSPDLIFGNKILPDESVSDLSGCLTKNGEILLLTNRPTNGSTEEQEPVLHGFLPNGDPDLQFGGGAPVVVRFNDQISRGVSVAVTDDEKILVGGTARRNEPELLMTMAVARYFSNGVLDSSFGKAGYWESEGYNFMHKMIEHDDSIYCVGNAEIGGRYASMTKLTRDGAPEATFNNGKVLVIDVPAESVRNSVNCRSVAVQSDGRIVAGGDAGKAFWLRVQPAGILDESFGNKGIASLQQKSSLFDLNDTAERILAAVDEDDQGSKVFGIQR